MRALYKPQKVKGCPNDLNHEKTTQKSWKYNSDSWQDEIRVVIEYTRCRVKNKVQTYQFKD